MGFPTLGDSVRRLSTTNNGMVLRPYFDPTVQVLGYRKRIEPRGVGS